MGLWLTRTLVVVAGVLLISAVGGLLGVLYGAPNVGLGIGALVALLWWLLRDSSRAVNLLRWLRGPMQGGAPRDPGLWGEIAYRVEKALRGRDQAIERERERLGQFLSAIEASPNGVLMLDESDQIEWCNSVAALHLGLDPARDRRQRVTNLVRMPAFVAHLQSQRFDEPLTVTAPQGRLTLWVVIRPYGEGMKLVLTQDITERERQEAMRRDFVANVSHEIRTPLTVLSGFVETLAGLKLSESERQRVLQLMQQQTDRMQSLVGDLLMLARLEGSPRPPADHWVRLQNVLERALSDAQSLSAGRHAVELLSNSDVEVAADEAELFSAVSNLLHNAVRYTPAGGRIVLAWKQSSSGGADIVVTDNGPGIAREHLPRLTERFYRVDSSRSRDTGGTGLGLAIVKHVMQRLGGTIDVESELGKGATFRLGLPLARIRRVAPTDANASSPANTTVQAS